MTFPAKPWEPSLQLPVWTAMLNQNYIYAKRSLPIWISTPTLIFFGRYFVDSEFGVQVGCVGQYGRPFDAVKLFRAAVGSLLQKYNFLRWSSFWLPPPIRSSILKWRLDQVALPTPLSDLDLVQTNTVSTFWSLVNAETSHFLAPLVIFCEELWCKYRLQNTNNAISQLTRVWKKALFVLET